jgi:uncharacterized protein (TIGR00730 family)
VLVSPASRSHQRNKTSLFKKEMSKGIADPMQRENEPSSRMPPNPSQGKVVTSSTATKIKSVCVYCGSGVGRSPAYAAVADTLGRELAARGMGLVYGGGSLGLMGQVARGVLAGGGRVTGIIPQFLSNKEMMLRDVQELIVVDDMHQRKRLMFERSDAFVALPGGIGTLEEVVEQLTWAQLGRHRKPIVLANIEGFWDPFLRLLEHMRDETFIRAGLEVRFVTVNKVEDILPAAEAAAAAVNGSGDVNDLKKIMAQF